MPYSPGTCRGCGTTCKGARCDDCKAKRRAEEKARRERLRAEGLCLKCARNPVAKSKLQDAGRKRVREPAAYCTGCLRYFAERA